MTGYAAETKAMPCGSLSMELRAVNNRYLDIQFRLPDELRTLEPRMRELLVARLNRGKIECRVNVVRLAHADEAQHINAGLLQNLMELDRAVRVVLPEARGLEVADILRWPGMLGADHLPAEVVAESCMELLRTVLEGFSAARAREGAKLEAMLRERLESMRRLVAEVSPRIPALIAAFQEKVKCRLDEAMIGQDDDRIRQELLLFMGKIDVDEELSRLQAHLNEVERILSGGGTVGKRLDFLMQELNREANTLGSKSVDVEVSRISVELKVLIEQMREQVQNIE